MVKLPGRRAALVPTILCLMGALAAPAASWADIGMSYPYQLAVAPAAGHGGDLLYLSGTRYRPHTKLTFLLGCPDAQPDGSDHMVVGRPGPVTDARGGFSAFPMHALILPSNMTAPMVCRIYVSDGYHPWGPADAPVYTVYADDQPLPSCTTRICLTVRQKFQRDKSGYAYVIAVRGWPGMSLRGTIRDRRGTQVGKAIVMSRVQRGKLLWRMTKNTACQPSLTNATVHVDATLGPYSGALDVPFTPSCR